MELLNFIECEVYDPYFCGVLWEQSSGEMPSEARNIENLTQEIQSIGYVISQSQLKKLKGWGAESCDHEFWELYTDANRNHKCLTLRRYPDKKRMVFKKSQ
jgi:hypothetical protein|tara:strand:- start:3430 stop:3732 length:303 start_codon:yes stop_codon:yes gene_type:complete